MTTLDRYSQTVVAIELGFGSTPVGNATGFLWDHQGQRFLVTNWHCLSGKNPFTGKHISNTLAEPDRLSLVWADTASATQIHRAEVDLRFDDGTPRWLVHPVLKSGADIAVLPLADGIATDVPPINMLPSEPLLLGVGMDVFLLGFPLGINASGLPIWKRASVASEPQILTPDRPYWLADTAGRPGMSGSPVVRRSWGLHAMEDGNFLGGQASATRIVGIYSGRFEGVDPLDAQLGIVWPIELILEAIALGRPDTD